MNWRERRGDTAWKARGACLGADPALFFPAREGVPADVAELCAGCPVRTECLEWALDNHEFGIWAGTTAEMRRRLRRQRRQQAA